MSDIYWKNYVESHQPHRVFFFLHRCWCGGIIWPFTAEHWNSQGERRPNKPRPDVYSKHDSGAYMEAIHNPQSDPEAAV